MPTKVPFLVFQRWLLIAAVLILAANSLALYGSLNELIDVRRRVDHTLQTRAALSRVRTSLLNAEAGQRGFLITADQSYLAPYHTARSSLSAALADLDRLMRASSEQAERAARLRALSDGRLQELAESIAARTSADTQTAAAQVATNRGKSQMDRIRELINLMDLHEEQLLEARSEGYQIAETTVRITLIVFVVTVLALIITLWLVMRRELMQRSAVATQLTQQAADLDLALRTQANERSEITRINELSSFLQSCASVSEAAGIIGPYLERLFPGCGGAIYQLASSRNQLTLLSRWGGHEPLEMLLPDECWALRRGHSHAYAADGEQPLCGHFVDHAALEHSVCVPLVAHGESLGLLCLTPPAGEPAVTRLPLAESAVKQIALALANLRLRDTLRQQSVRDPLTGLYNRRYMDEILRKEIAHSVRFKRPFSVVMADIDHFKRFNDTYGHAAGDHVLVTVANHLVTSLRECDWVFRYGGEELLIVLLETDRNTALAKADELRKSVSSLQLASGQQVFHSLTISMGLASFPAHGTELTGLLREADQALYRSKQQGRNRITVAPDPAEKAADPDLPAGHRQA